VTPSADQLKRAATKGRTATPGTVNPYRGQGALARAWMSGYKRSLLQMLEDSPSQRAYRAAQKETPRP
jgi:hypothetical protein